MNNVKDFGAVGDGISKDTDAIQQAINAGGIVHFPPGTYLSGTLYLRSNGGLDLEPGAVLLASSAPEDYNADDFCPQNRVFAREYVSGGHFIVAVEQENVVIRGGGRIDGNRRAIFNTNELNPKFNRPAFVFPNWRPAQMIYLCECNGITLDGVELYDAPYWTCFLHGCENFVIHGIRIWADRRTPNADGIDLDCCRYGTVSNCIIDCGDDCLTFRGCVEPLKKKRSCEFITVSNCVFRSPAYGVRVGVGTGLIKNCRVANVIIHDSAVGIGICPRFSRGFVQVEEISFDNLDIEARNALLFTSDCRAEWSCPEALPVRNINLSRIRAKSKRGSFFIGHTEGKISGFTLSDVDLVMTEPDIALPEAGLTPKEYWLQRNPPATLYVAFMKEMELHRVKIRANGGRETLKVIDSPDFRY